MIRAPAETGQTEFWIVAICGAPDIVRVRPNGGEALVDIFGEPTRAIVDEFIQRNVRFIGRLELTGA